jgi:tetratricopeptide (TPR) repeat protein
MRSIVLDSEWPGRADEATLEDCRNPVALLDYAKSAPHDWRRWFYVAYRYDELCDPRRAAGLYERVLELNPEMALAHYLLGRARLGMDDAVEGERDLLRAVELRPDLDGAWILLASLRSDSDRFSDALYAWQEAARIDPTGEIYWQIGRCLVGLGRLREATVALEEAVRMKPNHTPAHRALALLGHAESDEELMLRHLRLLFELDEDMAREIDQRIR